MSYTPEELSEIDVLDLSVQELRTRYQLINSLHDQLRTRVLALATIFLGFSTYVYANFKENTPEHIEGKFLLFAASGLIIAILYNLIRLLSSKGWEAPLELNLIPHAYQLHQGKLKYFEYVQSEYLSAIINNTKILGKNGNLFNWSIYLLVISVILIVVLKEGTTQ